MILITLHQGQGYSCLGSSLHCLLKMLAASAEIFEHFCSVIQFLLCIIGLNSDDCCWECS